MFVGQRFTVTDAQLDPMALRCYREINALEGKTGIKHGLPKGELKAISHYIETILPRKIAEGTFYLNKEDTGLSRTIEYDPSTKQTFIHLKRKEIKELGRGGAKTVTASILYGKKPQYVANSIFNITAANEREIHFIQQLKDAPGVVELISATTHRKAKTGEDVLQIITPLYIHGSLKSLMEKGPKLTFDEKISIMSDIFEGLGQMHDRGVAHGDIHQGNCLVGPRDVPPRRYKAVLTDLGTASNLGSNALLEVKDVFAAGCMLYEVWHETHRLPRHWDNLNKFAHLTQNVLPPSDDNTLLLGDLGAATQRYNALQHKTLNQELSNQEMAEFLILKMMHPTQNSFVRARDAVGFLNTLA